jgi:hypothetical protein
MDLAVLPEEEKNVGKTPAFRLSQFMLCGTSG